MTDEDIIELTVGKALPPMDRTDWQPIETAPKDGKVVDLFCVDENGQTKRFTDCHWGEMTKWHGGLTMGWWGLDRQYHVWTPTHWMPLPAAPTLETVTDF